MIDWKLLAIIAATASGEYKPLPGSTPEGDRNVEEAHIAL
jgi:hypothetical protein